MSESLNYNPEEKEKKTKKINSFEEKVNKIKLGFERDRKYWNKTLIKYSKSFSDLNKLAELQVNLYSDRQILIEKCAIIKDKYILYNKKHIEKKGEAVEGYSQPGNSDYMYKYNEKPIMVEKSVSNYIYILDVLNNQLDYLRETVKTIDKMIYGIKNSIEMEK